MPTMPSSPRPRPIPKAITRSPTSPRARTRSRRSCPIGDILTAPAAPGTYAVTLSAGQTFTGLDFGDFRTVTLGGEVYGDTNANGTLGAGESGLAGWTVELLRQLRTGHRPHPDWFRWPLHVLRGRPGDVLRAGSPPVGVRPDHLAGELCRDDGQRPGRGRTGLRRFPARHSQRRGVRRRERQRVARRRGAGPLRRQGRIAGGLRPGHRHRHHGLRRHLLVHDRRAGELLGRGGHSFGCDLDHAGVGIVRRDAGQRSGDRGARLRRFPDRHPVRRGLRRHQRRRLARVGRAGPLRLDGQPGQQLQPGHRRHDGFQRPLFVRGRRSRQVHGRGRRAGRGTSPVRRPR